MSKQEYKNRFIQHMRNRNITTEVAEAEFFGIEPDEPWGDGEPMPEHDADQCISHWND